MNFSSEEDLSQYNMAMLQQVYLSCTYNCFPVT